VPGGPCSCVCGARGWIPDRGQYLPARLRRCPASPGSAGHLQAEEAAQAEETPGLEGIRQQLAKLSSDSSPTNWDLASPTAFDFQPVLFRQYHKHTHNHIHTSKVYVIVTKINVIFIQVGFLMSHRFGDGMGSPSLTEKELMTGSGSSFCLPRSEWTGNSFRIVSGERVWKVSWIFLKCVHWPITVLHKSKINNVLLRGTDFKVNGLRFSSMSFLSTIFQWFITIVLFKKSEYVTETNKKSINLKNIFVLSIKPS